jgi:hypothetical protein
MNWLNNLILWGLCTDIFDDEEDDEDSIVVSIEYD